MPPDLAAVAAAWSTLPEPIGAGILAMIKAALTAYKVGNRVSKRIREKYPKGVPPKVVKETAGKLGAALPQCRNLNEAARRKGHERGVKAAAQAAERAASIGPVVWELRREGATLQAVADELNARGYVSRRGKPWSHVSVLRLLKRDGQAEGIDTAAGEPVLAEPIRARTLMRHESPGRVLDACSL